MGGCSQPADPLINSCLLWQVRHLPAKPARGAHQSRHEKDQSLSAQPKSIAMALHTSIW